jgi:hypothetical protein
MKYLKIILITVLVLVSVYLALPKNNVKAPEKQNPDTQNSGPYVFNTTYIGPVDWPAAIRTINEPYVCVEEGQETMRAGITVKMVIDSAEYCVTKESEGAAGTMYTNYTVSHAVGSNTEIANFSLKFPQCYNYDNPKQTECLTEQKNFDLKPIIKTLF